MLKTVFLVLSFIFSFAANSQTYTGTGGPIPDDGNFVVFPITVTGLTPLVIDGNFGVESVCINIQHAYLDDITVKLIAPDGTKILLAEHNGGSSDFYTATCFDDVSPVSINAGSSPYTGNFRPEEDMGYINNGQAGNGIWQLYILDTYPFADAGVLNNWSLTFGNNPAEAMIFTSSDLPIIVINTNGQTIVDDPKILVDYDLIDNGPGVINNITDIPYYNGYASIEIRGSSSQSFPKKSYGFESCDAAGNDINVFWLGMPAESDWILNANYSDKTLMRNSMSYYVWENMGHYASRCAFCEVVIDGKHQGVYIFMEKIKRDNNRVDIAKLTTSENTGDDLTGGYIFKIDKSTGSGGDGWTSNYLPTEHSGGQTIFFQYEYPDQDSITVQQKAYIRAYVDSFETALVGPQFADTAIGFRKFASDNSFIDYFLLNELSKNIDGYRLSTFLHKDKNSNGGKLKIGPAWDYDLAWHNADYYGGDNYTGWAVQSIGSGDYWQVPFWWVRFFQDTLFANDTKCRWEELRTGLLSETSLFHYIDSIATYIDDAKDRNFETWDILGTYVWPNPSPIPTTYAGEILNLKSWITNRQAWMDTHLPGICNNTFVSSKVQTFGVVAYPNPVTQNLFVEIFDYSGGEILISVKDISGRSILETKGNSNRFVIDMSGVKQGIYSLSVTLDEMNYTQKLVVAGQD